MSKELQTLDERIAEKVGKDLVDLIPKDQWQALVSSQINKFMQETAPEVIQKILNEKMMEDVRAILDGHALETEWNAMTGETTILIIKEMIMKTTPEIMSAMLAPAMSGLLNDLRNRLGSGSY